MNFFQGRYGSDQFGWFLFIVSFVLEIIGRITGIRILYYLGVICFVFMFARMFSRNIFKRQAENAKFLEILGSITGRRNVDRQRSRKKNGRRGRPVYCYFYCPSCKQQVRVPAGKGRVKVTCPKCHNTFETST